GFRCLEAIDARERNSEHFPDAWGVSRCSGHMSISRCFPGSLACQQIDKSHALTGPPSRWLRRVGSRHAGGVDRRAKKHGPSVRRDGMRRATKGWDLVDSPTQRSPRYVALWTKPGTDLASTV